MPYQLSWTNSQLTAQNGTHACYALAPAQGDLKKASFSRLFPVRVARALAARLALAVQYIHGRGFVHGDIHLRNVLIRLPSAVDSLTLKEFSETYGEPGTVPITRADGQPLPPGVPHEADIPLHLGKKAQEYTSDDAPCLVLSDFDCHTPVANRAPEVLFEPKTPLSLPSDIWSLALAIWEILGMKFNFSEQETVDEIVSQQLVVLGSQEFPVAWSQLWERTCTDDELTETIPRRPTQQRDTWPPLDEAFEDFVQKYRRQRGHMGQFEEEEVKDILSLMRGMLTFQPEQRWTIGEVMKSDWMVKWALPDLNR